MKAFYLPALLRETAFYNERLFRFKLQRENMKSQYLPAVLSTTLSDLWGLRPINWMDARLRGTEAYYPYALLSAYHWFACKFEFEPDAWIFGDSGGFSVATLGARIDPEDVIRWQIRNSHVGCLLDIPPHNIRAEHDSLRGYAAANFPATLTATVANVRRAAPIYERYRRDNPDGRFRWWGVLQGETEEQFERWYQAITDVYPFSDEGEGWAVKVFPSNDPRQLARALRFLKRKGIKNAHFLQSTATSSMATILSLGPEAGLEFVTFDSASASFGGINRVVFRRESVDDPRIGPEFGYYHYAEKSRNGETHARDFMISTCECFSCSLLREDLVSLGTTPEALVGKGEEAWPSGINSEYFKYRMIFHNTLQTIWHVQHLQRLAAEDAHYLLRYVLRDRYGATLRALDGTEPHHVPVGTPVSILDFAR